MAKKFLDLMGQRFGKLLITKNLGFNKRHYIIWEAICDCGNKIEILSNNLRSRNTQSCGCLRKIVCREKARKKQGQNGFTMIKHSYKKGAKNRNFSWNLNNEELMELFKGNCRYCGDKPSNISRNTSLNTEEAIKYSEFLYNGIDRLNNKEGYNIKNCVSCCKICNSMKSDFTIEEFLDKIRKIADFIKLPEREKK